jgi:hypothetical protein
MPERSVGHSKEFGGLDLDAVCSPERFFKESLLEILDVSFDIESFFREIRESAHARIRRDAFRQVLCG